MELYYEKMSFFFKKKKEKSEVTCLKLICDNRACRASPATIYFLPLHLPIVVLYKFWALSHIFEKTAERNFLYY